MQVMLNVTGPFGEFCRTEMFAYAVLFAFSMTLQTFADREERSPKVAI